MRKNLSVQMGERVLFDESATVSRQLADAKRCRSRGGKCASTRTQGVSNPMTAGWDLTRASLGRFHPAPPFLYSAIRLSGIFLLDVRHRSLMSSILSAAVTAGL